LTTDPKTSLAITETSAEPTEDSAFGQGSASRVAGGRDSLSWIVPLVAIAGSIAMGGFLVAVYQRRQNRSAFHPGPEDDPGTGLPLNYDDPKSYVNPCYQPAPPIQPVYDNGFGDDPDPAWPLESPDVEYATIEPILARPAADLPAEALYEIASSDT